MDNTSFEQVTQTVNQEQDTPAAETLDTLNRLNAAAESASPVSNSPLRIAGAILFFITAFAQVIFSIRNLVNFFSWLDSWYATFANTFPNILSFIGHLAAAGGFAIAGVCIILKKENMQLKKIAPLLIIGFCVCSVITDLIYLISWGSGIYVLYMLLNIVYALLWAALAAITFGYKPELTQKISIAYIIVPAVLLAVYFLLGISYSQTFVYILLTIVEYAAIIIAGVMIYLKSLPQSSNDTVTYSGSGNTYCDRSNTNSNQGADNKAVSPAPAVEPEGYTGIVKLVILSIVTFGIYVYIWIHRIAGYTGRRSAQGPQCSQGVQVVLCLFVPFYIIYWIYKQCKAIEDIRLRTIRTGSEDLSLICLLLSIFGFGIVAYALMQDQVNKLVNPSPAPAYDFYPPASQTAPVQETPAEETESSPAQETADPADTAAAATDAQIETVKKLKALLDAGILTQEEFDAKKKQVLEL